jgi:hypothetical protein
LVFGACEETDESGGEQQQDDGCDGQHLFQSGEIASTSKDGMSLLLPV